MLLKMKTQLEEFIEVLKAHKVYHKVYDHALFVLLVIDERIELCFDLKGNHLKTKIWE